MLKNATRTTLRACTRSIISVVVAGALIVPAVPFAQIAPAFADTIESLASHPLSAASDADGTNGGTGEDANSETAARISKDMPLDGSSVDAQGQIISSELTAELGIGSPVADDLGSVLNMDDGSILAPKTDEEKQAIIDGYMADGVLSEDDLQNEDLIKTLTGEYLEEQGGALTQEQIESLCGNCLDEEGKITQEIIDREAELDRLSQEAIEQDIIPTHEEVLANEKAALEEEQAATAYDPSISNEDTVGEQSYTDEPARAVLRTIANATMPIVGSRASFSSSASPATATAFSSTDATDGPAAYSDDPQARDSAYSTEVVIKDVKSATAYFAGSDQHFEDLLSMWIGGAIDFTTGNYAMLVEMYGVPSVFGQIVSGRMEEDGRYYFKIKLPTGEGESQKYADVFYGKVQKFATGSWSSYVYPSSTSITDDVVLKTLSSTPGYDPSRDRAYLNAYKLSPFASYSDIVRSGNAVSANSPLATKTISESWPVHKDDGMKVSLFEGQESDLVRNTVCFTDGTSLNFDLGYIGSSGLTASYTMGDTGMLYQPDFWIIGKEGKVGVDHIADFIRSKTWNNYFAAYFKTKPASKNVTFHRTIRDYFDQNMKNNAEEVAANLVSNIPTWNVSAASTHVWKAILYQAEIGVPDEQYDTTYHEVKLFNILFVHAYWGRFLDFDAGGNEQVGAQKNSNGFLVTAFRGDVIRSGLSLLSFTYALRSASMFTYANVTKLSSVIMPALFYPSTGINNAITFVEVIVKRTTGYADMADWFADYMGSIAFYHEYKPPEIEGVTDNDQLKWRGWDQAKRTPELMLYWLTLPPGSQYFASTSMVMASGPTGVYSKDVKLDDTWRAYFKTRLDSIFVPAARYASTVASIVGVDRPNMFCINTYDQKASKFDGGTSWMESEKLYGKTLTKDPFHANFSDPLLLYLSSAQGAAAMTVNQSDTVKRIHFLVYTSLGCNWSYYWSHEVAHAIDNTIFLNGNRRGGNNTEDYTDGLLTQSHGTMSYVMNLCFDYDPKADTLSNLTTERVTGKENLDDFYEKLYDTIDVVDYAALQAFLRLDKDEQNAVASQAWFSGHNGTSALDAGTTATILYSRNYILNGYDGTEATMPVNSSAFIDGSRKFETVEEVYDNQIFLRSGISDTAGLTWLWANYVSDDLRGVWWFPIHCNGNRPDSRSFKLQMYRMFGSNGFDAFSEFGRAGGGDLAKLKTITGYDSFKEWQMAKWDAIEKDKDRLGYITFDELVDKFETALKTDAGKADRNLTQMSNLRLRMLYMMKRLTNDFRYGIYGDLAPVKYIHNADELLAIADDPLGNYALANDIDIAGVDFSGRTSLVDVVFCGKIDGQGHRIYSSENEIVPRIFTGAKQAYIKNITIEGVTVQSPAISVVNCELENLRYTIFERDVYDVEDFEGIANDLKLGVNIFHLKKDLDLTEWSTANAALEESARKKAVMSQLVSGTQDVPKIFNGNGHVISGLTGASLFDRLCFAKISDLSIVDSSNEQSTTDRTDVSLFATHTYKCDISDIYFNNVSLKGKTTVGFLAGNDGFINVAGKDTRDGGSVFRRIQIYNGTMVLGDAEASNPCYGGFLTGRTCFSDLEDIYVHGSLTSFGTSVGGMVGAMHKGGKMNRCISSVNTLRKKNNVNVGVLLGDIESPNFDASVTKISNCLGLGLTTNVRYFQQDSMACSRFANMTAKAADVFENCFESLDYRAGISLGGAAVPGVKGVRTTCSPWGSDADGVRGNYSTVSLRDNIGFYTDLGFSADVWDFDPTIQIGNPVLRFEGDKSTFYDYDLDFSVDFENERLVFTGSDYDMTKLKIHNLPFYTSKAGVNHEYKEGMWYYVSYTSTPSPMKNMTDDPTGVDLSRIIEQGPTTGPSGQPVDGFANYEVEENGFREVTLVMETSASGKAYNFEKSLNIPPRLENTYADNIKGIGAGSNGIGAIRVVSVGAGGAPALEYRQIPDSADAGDGDWIALGSDATAVKAGKYEVRMAATDRSFASFPSTVEVAEFDPNSIMFPLTLDPMGGSWADGFTSPDTYNTEAVTTLPVASDIHRDGYTFTGWYTSADASGTAVTQIPAGNTMPIVLYAGWKADSYSVALDLNGGVLSNAADDIKSYTHGTAVALPTPTRLGHGFAGWYADSSFAGDPVTEISAESIGAKQFFAKWAANTYNVTLDPVGGVFAPEPEAPEPEEPDDGEEGSGSDGAGGDEGAGDEGADDEGSNDENSSGAQGLAATGGVFSYTFGVGAPLPDADKISREGYEFGGWYNNAAYSGSAVSFISATEIGDKQFWAKWIPHSYDVTLVKNGGTLKPGERDVTRYEFGRGAVLPQLERPGFTFDGWYADPDFADQPTFAIDGNDMGDKQFWAKWTELKFDITYELGFDSAGDFAPEIDLSAFETYNGGSTMALPGSDIMVWENHTFAGWYTDPAFTGSSITELTPGSVTSDMTLYAKWVGDACIVFYYTNGGTFDPDPKTVYEVGVDDFEKGDPITLPIDPQISRPGYTFEGWYLDASFTDDAVTEVILDEPSISLYAKWKVVEYSILYEKDGASWVAGYAPPDRYTVEMGDVVLPTSNDIYKEDFTFVGWHIDPSLSDDPVNVIESGCTGDITLYAAWKSNQVVLPDLEIISISLGGLSSAPPVWDRDGYARIELSRDKVPLHPSDFDLTVPEGVLYKVAEHEAPAALWLFEMLSASRDASESKIWDITLWSEADPTLKKLYVLEIVPIDEGGDDGDGSGGDDGSGDDDKPPTGGDDGDSNKPPTGDGDGNGGTGDGSGNGNGDNNGSGDGPGGAGNNGGGVSGGNGSSGGVPGGSTNAGGSASVPNNGSVSGGPSSDELAKTGDDEAVVLYLLGGVALAALVLALIARRRASS